MENRLKKKRADLVNAACAGLLVLILGIVLSSVFCRYVLNQSLTWSDEVVRYLFVWFTLVGSAAALRDRLHIRVEFFVDYLPKEWQRVFDKISLSLIVLFNAALFVLGILWVLQTRGAYTPAMGMPLNMVFYGALPFAAALSVWFGMRRFCSPQDSAHPDSLSKGTADESESLNNHNTEEDISVDTGEVT